MTLAGILWKSVRDFFGDKGLILAGSLSYSMMMALVPFCLFLLTMFGYVLGHYPEFYRFFLGRLVSFFPEATRDINREILKLMTHRHIGKFSLLLFAFLSFQAFSALEYALNAVFKTSAKRRLSSSVMLSFAVVTVIIILVIGSFIAASMLPLLTFIPGIKIGSATRFFIGYVLPFAGVFLGSALLYKLLPKRAVKLSSALAGGVFAALFLEIAKYAFSWYVSAVSEIGKIYGSLTAFVLFLLWIFYSSCIFLIGAELAHNLGVSRRK